MCEVNFSFEPLFDELVACKLASVVSGDAFDVSDEWCHHGHDGFSKFFGILSPWQFPHEQIVLASLHEGYDGSPTVFSDDGIHFPVSESGAVCLRFSLIYHCPVLDGRVGKGASPFDVLHPVPATLVEFPSAAAVEADIAVNGFDADAFFSLAQHPASDLFGRPLLVDHQCDDLLSHLKTEFAVPAHTAFAFVTLPLGNAPMVTVPPLIAFQLAVNSAVVHVYRICNVFYRPFLFQQYRNCVSLC